MNIAKSGAIERSESFTVASSDKTIVLRSVSFRITSVATTVLTGSNMIQPTKSSIS